MLEYLDKLRMKPRHVRERIAVFVTVVFSLFIALVWWGVWSADRAVGNDAVAVKEISPLSAVADIAGRAKDSTQSLFGKVTDPVSYSASGTTDVAQVGSAFDGQKQNDVVYASDIIDNTIHVSAAKDPDTATSTEAE